MKLQLREISDIIEEILACDEVGISYLSTHHQLIFRRLTTRRSINKNEDDVINAFWVLTKRPTRECDFRFWQHKHFRAGRDRRCWLIYLRDNKDELINLLAKN